ncbi:putative deoxyribose-phosphate aldolase [Corynebacterium kutscheri]|uniref:hypothetical protein n=1 Tax=Corynebacterium kutscheri TaxID=35755 RepID=UPI000F6EE632|nr:hypothetical protein [Corynebacterium kutscheri]VEH80666.1 putative deoxyribose-phosphate aldolase [Corynebacterium kutscheri]
MIRSFLGQPRDKVPSSGDLLVDPTLLDAITSDGRVLSVAGYPTGRHHSLVKAAEARLAVQCGATEIVVVLDDTRLFDSYAVMSELIALRESVTQPAKLILAVDTLLVDPMQARTLAHYAHKCAFDGVLMGWKESAPEFFQELPPLEILSFTPGYGTLITKG